MKKLRILVVEDSLTVRKRLVEVLNADPHMEVIAEAADGKQAIALCQDLRPDVITLDMMLPVMSGLAATEYIMAHCPTPILVVSSSTNRGELFKTYEALAAGAVDVMEKPQADDAAGDWEQRFISTVRLVSRVRVITHLRARMSNTAAAAFRAGENQDLPAPAALRARSCELIAIGASTGGPKAVVQILQALPVDFPIPVLIVVHIGEPFGFAFADWLDGQVSLRSGVKIAVNGQPLTRGVFMAPPTRHMVVRNNKIILDDGPERHSCKPSVDVLFESLATEDAGTVAAALLTGMGSDGARGLLALRRSGATTIAQDEASSVVYGMPREAALLGAAQDVLPLSDIGPALVRLAQGRKTP
ncbi:chemotaxis-specific protein-glutamate methyltransferase CheB [Undibacterium sp.]|jgi:two-component system chemotaxis response regulator CheB|uniref:chemotaxis-specific protein-glutamate methyltransferase CheB n=1 Tax=Undibacterium sp. TaxID=1914977 RepID=UPI002BFFE928|nr:chemotaxis-specific protein-glutamate methyltransferase CheB [Undibacterium sp.]HTD06108.1 chemotaxis-specific protein-glutamate methyltransferase CheB [Undibacterium sp.]